MPNCFTLTRKGEKEPAKLSAIDDELCAHFGVEPHASRYYMGWVDSVGLALAMGRDWEWMRKEWANDWSEVMPIIDYLSEWFTPDAWAEVGRR